MFDALSKPGGSSSGPMTLAVVSPAARSRQAAAAVFAQCGDFQIQEFPDYPSDLDSAPHLFERAFDIVLIDVDGDPQFALQMVEVLCASRSLVMVFSASADPGLMLRSMHAGAREFFTIPFERGQVAKALQWLATHRQQTPAASKPDGRLLVFFGSKGGAGVTTLATNFAVALAEQSGQSTLLIDLNLRLGDAASNLGIHAPYSTADAFENTAHLNAAMLSRLVATHASGLAVLSAPSDLLPAPPTPGAISALMAVARQAFHYVVVDAGKKIDLSELNLLEPNSTSYLVTQVGIPELRNANRLIGQFAGERNQTTLEVIINRYEPHYLGLTEEHLTKALTRKANWKIPNDYKAVQKMLSTANPLVYQDLPIARAVREIARSVCGVAYSAPQVTAPAPIPFMPARSLKTA
jgi:pilus assembly protein CpaE